MTEPQDGPPNDTSGRATRHASQPDDAPPQDAAATRDDAAVPDGAAPPHVAVAPRQGTAPQYKGAPLEAARGPGLGCFWIQVVVLAILLVATPLSVVAGAPSWVSAAMLIVTLVLLLFAGQTVIFLLRLVAADRRSRRRPLHPAARPTVGDLEERSAPDDQARL